MGAPAEGFDPLDPSNMSPLVVALCADEAQGITGQVFHVWGGAINALHGWSAGELFAARREVGRRRAARRARRPLPRRRRARRDDRGHAGRRRPVAARAVTRVPQRRRIYLMRHAQVRYFQGEHPHDVLLTDARARRRQRPPRRRCATSRFDRVITSGLPRTLETARAVAPDGELEENPALREIESGELRGVAPEVVQEMMTTAFRGVVPLDTRFLGGETIGELLRPRPARARRAARRRRAGTSSLLVLHGAVNRAILGRALTGDARLPRRASSRRPPASTSSTSTPRLVRSSAPSATRRTTRRTSRRRATTTMEQLWQEYLDARARGIRRVSPQPGMGLLSLQNASLRFGGIVALDDVSLEARGGHDLRPDRPERRRQDDGVQRDHAALPRSTRATSSSTASRSCTRRRAASSGSASRARSRTSSSSRR